MEITNKQALEAMKTIKAYCGEQDCENCRFITGDDECYFVYAGRTGDSPNEWLLPSLPRWTKTDKALAEALKLAGVDAVERFAEMRTLVLLAGCRSLADHNGILDAFHDLQPGERISLEDIVNSKGEKEND